MSLLYHTLWEIAPFLRRSPKKSFATRYSAKPKHIPCNMKTFLKANFFSIAVSLCTAIAMIFLILFPALGTGAATKGLTLWAQKIVPTLFPFFFLSSLLVHLGTAQKIAPALSPVTRKLFRTGGESALIYAISVFSGYPVGSKMIADFVERGLMEKDEAVRASAFCSTAGPLFIVGSVGTGMFGSPSLGAKMLLAHLLGGLLAGVCFRGRGNFAPRKRPLSSTKSTNPLYDSVYSAVISTLMVGGFICVFSVVSELLFISGIVTPIVRLFGMAFSHVDGADCLAKGLTVGLLECTGGSAILSQTGATPLAASLSCAVISFGGLCVFAQSVAHLKRAGLPVKTHFFAKILHALFAFMLCLLFLS